MPFIALSRSSFVSVLPPIMLRNNPPIVPKLEPTMPVDDELVFAFLASAVDSIECTSSSRSFSTNSPLPVLFPHDSWLTASTVPGLVPSSASSSVASFAGVE